MGYWPIARLVPPQDSTILHAMRGIQVGQDHTRLRPYSHWDQLHAYLMRKTNCQLSLNMCQKNSQPTESQINEPLPQFMQVKGNTWRIIMMVETSEHGEEMEWTVEYRTLKNNVPGDVYSCMCAQCQGEMETVKSTRPTMQPSLWQIQPTLLKVELLTLQGQRSSHVHQWHSVSTTCTRWQPACAPLVWPARCVSW